MFISADRFYYSNPANGWAAIKAFTVTRVGDVFLLIALFLLYQQFGTLNIQYIVANAAQVMTLSSSLSIWTALMLFLEQPVNLHRYHCKLGLQMQWQVQHLFLH